MINPRGFYRTRIYTYVFEYRYIHGAKCVKRLGDILSACATRAGVRVYFTLYKCVRDFFSTLARRIYFAFENGKNDSAKNGFSSSARFSIRGIALL